MLFFSSHDPLEVYLAKTIHTLLGIEFRDSFQLKLLGLNENNASQSIEFRDLENNTVLSIKTIISSLIKDNFSLVSEKYNHKDSLGRVIYKKEEINFKSEPRIDLEVFRIRKLLIEKLDNNNFEYSLNLFSSSPIVCLTHDVDSIKSNSLIKLFYRTLKCLFRLDTKTLNSLINEYKRLNYNSHGDFKAFMDLEKELSRGRLIMACLWGASFTETRDRAIVLVALFMMNVMNVLEVVWVIMNVTVMETL